MAGVGNGTMSFILFKYARFQYLEEAITETTLNELNSGYLCQYLLKRNKQTINKST